MEKKREVSNSCSPTRNSNRHKLSRSGKSIYRWELFYMFGLAYRYQRQVKEENEQDYESILEGGLRYKELFHGSLKHYMTPVYLTVIYD